MSDKKKRPIQSDRRIFDWIQRIFVLILSFGYTNGYQPMNRYDLYNDIGPAPAHRMKSGSAPMTKGHSDIVFIAPQYNRTQFFVEQRDIMTMNHPPPQLDHPNALPLHNHRPRNRECVRCPDQIMAIAKEGLDGFIVEPPAPIGCSTHLPYSPDLYQIETLFGNQFMFVLPHGKHSIFGKIRNIETGLIERTCLLKYNVLVRHCPRYHLKNRQLKMRCSAGKIWGSSCSFECRVPNAQLSHQEPIVCTETSEWIGQEPSCVMEMKNDVERAASSIYQRPIDSGACQTPPRPANGKYTCEFAPYANFSIAGRDLPVGTICRIQCDPLYTIPYHLRDRSVIECENGAWNMTKIELCYRTRPQWRPRPFDVPKRSAPTTSRIRVTTYV